MNTRPRGAIRAHISVPLACATAVALAAAGVLALTPGGASTVTCPARTLVFSATYTDSAHWTVGRSSAYPGNGPTNTADSKLDWISPTNAPSSAGLFDARKRLDGYWNTDLATTEYSSAAFKVRTGDTVTAIVTLPKATDAGAWPAIWTWGSGALPGHGEVDLFEWHNDHPAMLEFSNHVGGGSAYVDHLVTPGVPFDLQVDLLAAGVVWRVNGSRVFTGGGLPSTWSAYLIVNLSVSSGRWHPAPTTNTYMAYRANALRVWR